MSKIMNYLLAPAVCLMAAGCGSQSGAPAIAQDPEVEKKVEEILADMTLEEKVGQMTELAIDVLGEFKDGEFILDEEKLHEVIAGYKVGSILNAPGPMAQSLEKWQEIIGRIQEVSMKEIGIPCIYGQMAGNHRPYPGSVHEGNRDSVHLRSGSGTRHYLHSGRHYVPSEHKHGRFTES